MEKLSSFEMSVYLSQHALEKPRKIEALGKYYKHSRNQTFSRDRCFICGSDKSITKEHVLPQWLIRRNKLGKLSNSTLNNTLVKYARLIVPCCQKCNNETFGGIESFVHQEMNKGFNSFIDIDRKMLYLWITKIYYGLYYKDTEMRLDIKDNGSSSIIHSDYLRSYQRYNHLLLQSAFGDLEWPESYKSPGSIFIYNCLESSDFSRNFDFLDNMITPVVGIRSGDIGIICILRDWEYVQKNLPSDLNFDSRNKLHPVQFREIWSLFTSYYTHTAPETKYSLEIKNPTNSIKPLQFKKISKIDDNQINLYSSRLLALSYGIDPRKLEYPGKKFWTSLVDETGNFNVTDNPDIPFKISSGDVLF